ncbi:TPA: GAF domain-containing protein [Burkholderia cepacia]|uniref:GAF domain-containing protein n=3 Tax=Burkholderia cepacia complex TaxID=87882 RepID=A0A250LKQ9_9BURK|nr:MULTISPECIES: GAF domain-containing protein [Burkholderia cepacia complex]MCA8363605.1 GAF domain-containing protein [Burkholderia cepacia]USB83889.1 GAF domain-containing protein [Burkholderia cenocepacia]CAB3974259.1 hypothetical protein BLA3211_07924 [Burkholderia aenigmatica]BBA43429.1 hypothetical protein BCCH1_59290 [Burkholderia contaminans]BBA45152.1 hypothetical protein BCCH1_76630 [Burkholderia contaminans]
MDSKLSKRKMLLVMGSTILASCTGGITVGDTRRSVDKDISPRNIEKNEAATISALALPNQPDPGLAAIDRGLANTVGHKLFTVLMVDLSHDKNQRYYSNQPGAYPVGGSKPIVRSNDFFRDVVVGGKPRICRNYEDMKKAFFDHELIRSLGCESAVNYPIRWDGKTVGTLNLLHQENWYSEADLPAIDVFAGLAIAPLQKIISQN